MSQFPRFPKQHYHAIEARVLFWLAGDQDVLNAFREKTAVFSSAIQSAQKGRPADFTDIAYANGERMQD